MTFFIFPYLQSYIYIYRSGGNIVPTVKLLKVKTDLIIVSILYYDGTEIIHAFM